MKIEFFSIFQRLQMCNFWLVAQNSGISFQLHGELPELEKSGKKKGVLYQTRFWF